MKSIKLFILNIFVFSLFQLNLCLRIASLILLIFAKTFTFHL